MERPPEYEIRALVEEVCKVKVDKLVEKLKENGLSGFRDIKDKTVCISNGFFSAKLYTNLNFHPKDKYLNLITNAR